MFKYLGVHPHTHGVTINRIHCTIDDIVRTYLSQEMSESQLPERCTKCGFDFSAFAGGIEFNFCPKCACPRVKLEQADGEPTLNGSSTNGFTSNGHESTVISNGHENTMVADNPNASHADQGEVHDSTIEQHASAVEDADGPSKSTEVEESGDSTPLAELAKDETLSTEKDLSQKQPREAEKLVTGKCDAVPAEAEPKIIPAQTHEAGKALVEERPSPEDQTSEGVNDFSVASGSSNQVLS